MEGGKRERRRRNKVKARKKGRKGKRQERRKAKKILLNHKLHLSEGLPFKLYKANS